MISFHDDDINDGFELKDPGKYGAQRSDFGNSADLMCGLSPQIGVFGRSGAKTIEVRPGFAQFRTCRWGPTNRSEAIVTLTFSVLSLLALLAAAMQYRLCQVPALQAVKADRWPPTGTRR